MRSRRLAAVAAFSITAGVLTASPAANADTGSTLYVNNGAAANCSDATTDSATTPYCTIQAAVDVVSAGQTILVAGGTYAPFTVTTSGTASSPITVKGSGADSALDSSTTVLSKTATAPISVSGAGFVDVSNFSALSGSNVPSTAGPQVSVTSSTNVTISQIYALRYTASQSTSPAVSIDGASSAVTLSRSRLTSEKGSGVQIASGSSGDVITTNVIASTAAPGVVVSGAPGTDVTSNTLTGSCGQGIILSGASTGSSIQNNIVEGLTDSTSSATCATPAASTSGIEVDGAATAGTTLNYNIVYAASAADSAYDWAGADFATASALYKATEQGREDLTTDPLVPAGSTAYPAPASPAIDSANSSAPGELGSDIYNDPRIDDPGSANTGAGSASYYDRGAVEVQGPMQFNTITVSATQAPVGGTVTFTASGVDSWGNEPLYFTFAFGDGTTAPSSSSPVTHAYKTAGAYTAQAYVGYSATGLEWGVVSEAQVVVVNSSAPLVPKMNATAFSALTVATDATGSTDAWSISSYTVNYGDGTTVTGTNPHTLHAYTKPGIYPIKLTETDGGGNTVSTTTTYATAGTEYSPYGPTRILDTRNGTGTGGVIAKVPAGGHVVLKIEGNGTIPANDVAAVVLNITSTDTSGSGFVTAYPDGQSVPNVSNLDYTQGKNVADSAIVPVGADGSVDLYNGGAEAKSIDLVADVTGYFSQVATDKYTAVSPDRLLDTRNGTGTGGTVAKVKAGQSLPLTIAGADSGALPGSGITAVSLNVTVTDTTGSGFVTAYPGGQSVPNASNLNYVQGQTVAGAVIVPVSSTGKIELYDGGGQAGPVDLIADVTGYYSSGGTSVYVPVTPTRLLDTRTAKPLAKWGVINVSPATPPTNVMNATGYVLNTTVTGPTGTGYITAYPAGPVIPNISSLNYVPGLTVANLTQVTGLPEDGEVSFFNGGNAAGSTQLIVDLFGYYASS